MNRKSAVVSALLATLWLTIGIALADEGGDRRERNRDEHGQRGGPSDQRDQTRRGDDERQQERGAGPNHQYHRGERLPVEYRHRQYVVDDWREHHLRAPPRGYHWVQMGSDYVLVAITTGIILQLLLGH